MSRRSIIAASAVAACLLVTLGGPATGSVKDQNVGTVATGPNPSTSTIRSLATTLPFRSSISGRQFYFVMTDRYRNGRTDNDTGGLSGGTGSTGFDPTSNAWFHGGDFAGLTGNCVDDDGLARIRRLGFDAIWITPPFVQQAVQGSSGAYHGYWFLDITKPDPHWGTPAEFASFVTCAHHLGIKVFADIVVNHTADVISYLDGTSYSNTPKSAFVPGNMTSAKSPSWLNNPVNYHNRGDIDWNSCVGACLQLGDFAGLDDLATEKTLVWQGLADAYAAYASKYRLDGFRIDTARHVDDAFFGRFIPRVTSAMATAGVKGFTAFGEIYVPDMAVQEDYVTRRGLPSVLDFVYQKSVLSYVTGIGSGRSMARMFDQDDEYTTPAANAYGLATFLGNHDMGRIGYLLKSNSSATGTRLLQMDLLAHDILYLTRGVPIVYYGDEVGMTGSGDGTDKNARQDMFSTQVPGWQDEPRIGSPAVGTSSAFAQTATNPVAARLTLLASVRAKNPALASGAQITRYGSGPVFVESRIDRVQRREYVVAFNTGATSASVTFQTSTPGASWTTLLGSPATRLSRANGTLTVTVPARGTLALKASLLLPRAPKVSISLSVAQNYNRGTYQLSATVPGQDPSVVTFAYRIKGTAAWVRLGTDDARPFRVQLDPLKLRSGTKVDVIAVVRSSSGAIASSRLVPLTVTRFV